MSFSVGGLSTGLDTKSIISQMLTLDAQPKTRAEWSKALWDSRKSSWNDLNGRLTTLQTYSNTLLNASTWTSSSGISSSNASAITAAASGTKPAAGSYQVAISQLATNEVWSAGSALGGSTSGVRQTGIWTTTGSAALTGTDLLTTIRDQTGTSAGVNSGSTITMSWNVGASSNSATFEVSATSTFADLASWAESQIPGATVAINGGRLEITSSPGTAKEVTGLSFSAKNNAGTTLTRFNGSFGSSSSMVTAASNGGAPDDETIIISQGGTTRYVSIAAGDSQAAIVSKIQAAAGTIVNAGISGGKLNVTSLTSGAGGGFSITGSGSLLTSVGLTQTTAAQDASFTVNGTAYTKSSNTGITGVISDVSLNLSDVTTSNATLTVGAAGASTDDLKKKILDFTNQYNSVLDLIRQKTSEKKVPNAKTLGEYLQGPMVGDVRFARVSDDLRNKVTSLVTGQPTGFKALADIGITTGAIGSGDRTGKLVVDESKLEEALNTNRSAVKDLFAKVGTGSGVTADDGIARKISETISLLKTGGSVDSSIQGATSQIKSLQTSIDRYTKQLDDKKGYYDRMFAALEKNVSGMQSQSKWLSGQLSSLG